MASESHTYPHNVMPGDPTTNKLLSCPTNPEIHRSLSASLSGWWMPNYGVKIISNWAPLQRCSLLFKISGSGTRTVSLNFDTRNRSFRVMTQLWQALITVQCISLSNIWGFSSVFSFNHRTGPQRLASKSIIFDSERIYTATIQTIFTTNYLHQTPKGMMFSILCRFYREASDV